jgi:polyphosphate kinase
VIQTPREQPSAELFTNADVPYINRELSWIEFNLRVLEEATDPRNPLLERVKFLAIFFSNLDEFFMIRVSGIKQQVAANVQKESPDGLTPSEQLVAIRRILLSVMERTSSLLMDDLLPTLTAQGIYLLNYDQLDTPQRAAADAYFNREIFPILTPLAFDTSRPFPHISNLSLNLAIVIKQHDQGELFARVKVPEVLPRLLPLPADGCDGSTEVPPERRYCFVWIEQLIAAHLHKLFPGMEIIESYPFRVIRNADMEIEEDEADDLLHTIERGVQQRQFGEVVLVRVHHTMPERICRLLLTNLKISPDDLYTTHTPLDIAGLFALMKLDRPDLKDDPIYPGVPAALQKPSNIFDAIRQQDILLHHPFDSFAPVVEFIEAAASDPQVLAIKQTLYRVGSNSPIVQALMNAREQGKQVAVVVELKARFDEENNITWARALEKAGVHVIYGLVRLKTHCKIALVVRRETDGIRRYVHMSTGNYNASTARLYTDIGFLTCRDDIGADATDVFNFLTGHSRQRHYRKLLVAPITLRERLMELVEREIAQHQAHGGGHIIGKFNSLVDPKMIDSFYHASQAGVRVDLVVRGICSLIPGRSGLSENIHVRSIVGRFLEHNRIYYFHNGGNEEVYLGSADVMQRNLDRRVETLFPLEDPTLIRYVRGTLLERYLRDNVRARVLQPDSHYQRLAPQEGEPVVDSQTMEMGYHTYQNNSNGFRPASAHDEQR